MLRLVHPAPVGQAPARRRKGLRSPQLALSAEEKRHLRIALHNLRRAFGTWACLADAIGVRENTLVSAARERAPLGSAALALRAAQVGGMSVEAVLSGTLSAAGKCESCGSRLGHGLARAAGGAS